MNQRPVKQTFGWPIVIIALILFWPVGLILLFVKLANDRSASFGSGAGAIRVIGGILIFFAFIALAFTFDAGGPVGIVFLLVFLIPGILLMKKGGTVKKTGNINRRYIDMIVNNKVRDLDELARRMQVPKQRVINDVQSLINRGMLGRARLNLNTEVIQFPRPKPRPTQQQRRDPQQVPNEYQTRAQPQFAKPQRAPERFEPKTIRCKSCSANNWVEELPARCEYCGSSLH